jgi:hypothetical protein
METLVAAAIILAALAVGCDTSESTNDGHCAGGGACGYHDHRCDSTFYCPPAPFVPGGWFGYTWHDNANGHEECEAATSWGCSPGGCFLDGSGVTGETVACVCRWARHTVGAHLRRMDTDAGTASITQRWTRVLTSRDSTMWAVSSGGRAPAF